MARLRPVPAVIVGPSLLVALLSIAFAAWGVPRSAMTEVAYSDRTGAAAYTSYRENPDRCYVEITPEFAWASPLQQARVLLHEAGHCLVGLYHPGSWLQGTMLDPYLYEGPTAADLTLYAPWRTFPFTVHPHRRIVANVAVACEDEPDPLEEPWGFCPEQPHADSPPGAEDPADELGPEPPY